MKVKEIKKTFSNRIPMSYIDKTINLDTTPTKKYTTYVLSILSKTPRYYYHIEEIFEMLSDFEKYKPYIKNKDIYSPQYKSLDELKKVVNVAKIEYMFKKHRKKLAKEIFILDETDDYILFHPKTHEASKKYGYNTRWCVTQDNERYFNSYKQNLIFLINKKHIDVYIYQKMAFHGHGNTLDIFDSTDSMHTIEHFINYFGQYYNSKKIIRKCKKFMYRRKNYKFKKLLPWSMVNKLGY